MRYIPILLLLLAAASCSTVKHDQKALAKAYSRNKTVTDKWFNDFYGKVATGSSTTYSPGDSTGYLDWIAALNRELAELQEREPDTLWGYVHDTVPAQCPEVAQLKQRLAYILSHPPPPIRDTINHTDTVENKAAIAAANSRRDEAVTLAAKQSDRADKVTGQRNIAYGVISFLLLAIGIYIYFKLKRK